jgi:hypothetical protein
LSLPLRLALVDCFERWPDWPLLLLLVVDDRLLWALDPDDRLLWALDPDDRLLWALDPFRLLAPADLLRELVDRLLRAFVWAISGLLAGSDHRDSLPVPRRLTTRGSACQSRN